MARQSANDPLDDPLSVEILQRILSELSARDREVIRRFYGLNQSPEEICRELKLTRAQFLQTKKAVRGRFDTMRKS